MKLPHERSWEPHPADLGGGGGRWFVSCDCGFDAVSVVFDDVVRRAQEHARQVHHMELSAELVASLVRRGPST